MAYKATIILLLSVIALGEIDTSYREGFLGAVIYDECIGIVCPID